MIGEKEQRCLNTVIKKFKFRKKFKKVFWIIKR